MVICRLVADACRSMSASWLSSECGKPSWWQQLPAPQWQCSQTRAVRRRHTSRIPQPHVYTPGYIATGLDNSHLHCSGVLSKSGFRRSPCKASCAPAMHSWTRRDPPRPPGAPSGSCHIAEQVKCYIVQLADAACCPYAVDNAQAGCNHNEHHRRLLSLRTDCTRTTAPDNTLLPAISAAAHLHSDHPAVPTRLHSTSPLPAAAHKHNNEAH
jgi:hypothetical protein